MIVIVGGYSSRTLEGGQTGDNLESFGEVVVFFWWFGMLLLDHSYSCMKGCVESSQCWDWSFRGLELGMGWWQQQEFMYRDQLMGSSISLLTIRYSEWLMKWERFLARCDYNFPQRKPINNSAACLSPAILRSEFLSIQGVGSVGGTTIQDPWIVDRIKRRIITMLLIIWTLSFLYTKH
jgi:hypothetical protein